MEPAIAKMERRERTKNTLEAGKLSLEYPRVRGKRSVRAEVDTNKNHVFRGFKGSAGDPLLIFVTFYTIFCLFTKLQKHVSDEESI